MSDEKDEKEESTSITTHTRKRNWISGIDNDNVALAVAGFAGLVALYSVLKDPINNMLQRVDLARQQQTPPPPPPVEPVPTQAAPTQVQTEYTEEEQVGIRQPNGSIQTTPDNEELQEVDHKNYQTRRNPKRNGGSSESPFGAAIARG